MGRPASVQRSVLEVGTDGAYWRTDEVASEWPVTLYVNGDELITIVATPEHLDELALGYLASEGLLSGMSDVQSLAVDAETLDVHVTLPSVQTQAARAALFARRYVAACCGKGRASLYFAGDLATVRPLQSNLTLTAADCHVLMQTLQAGSAAFRRTGGLHNACIARGAEVLATRADVGRHNALDKLHGYCLQKGIELSGLVVAFSGRVSSEILLKAVKLGAPIVISKSAPTELALAMAEDLGVMVVGFVRGDRLNVYTHAERLALGTPRA